MKGALEVQFLSLRDLCQENLEEGLCYWGIQKDTGTKAQRMGISFHGGPGGTHGVGGGGPFTENS